MLIKLSWVCMENRHEWILWTTNTLYLSRFWSCIAESDERLTFSLIMSENPLVAIFWNMVLWWTCLWRLRRLATWCNPEANNSFMSISANSNPTWKNMSNRVQPGLMRWRYLNQQCPDHLNFNLSVTQNTGTMLGYPRCQNELNPPYCYGDDQWTYVPL